MDPNVTGVFHGPWIVMVIMALDPLDHPYFQPSLSSSCCLLRLGQLGSIVCRSIHL